ncbi:MAG: hypothetical protein WAO98_07025 [Alphaproteobacteria bacterium]
MVKILPREQEFSLTAFQDAALAMAGRGQPGYPSDLEKGLKDWQQIEQIAALRLSSPVVLNNMSLIMAILGRKLGLRLAAVYVDTKQTILRRTDIQTPVLVFELEQLGVEKISVRKVVFTILQIQDIFYSPSPMRRAIHHADLPSLPVQRSKLFEFKAKHG